MVTRSAGLLGSMLEHRTDEPAAPSFYKAPVHALPWAQGCGSCVAYPHRRNSMFAAVPSSPCASLGVRGEHRSGSCGPNMSIRLLWPMESCPCSRMQNAVRVEGIKIPPVPRCPYIIHERRTRSFLTLGKYLSVLPGIMCGRRCREGMLPG